MKQLALLILLCFMLVLTRAQEAPVLSTDDFQKGLSKPGVQLLDVRRTSEYQAGHISNSLQADWTNLDEFKNRIAYLDKNKPVMVYCAVGGRSHAAAEWMRNNGFANVQELQGGMTAWRSGNKPVEGASKEKQMTMDEYTALTNSSGKVLIEFGGEWCPPCKKMEPVLARLQAEMKDGFKLVKIDGGIQADLMQKLRVDALPAFIVYKGGKETWRKQGIAELSELKGKLAN